MREQIARLVYAHGGGSETPVETLEMLEARAREYAMRLTRVICAGVDYAGGRSLDDGLVRFALRLDRTKSGMFTRMCRDRQLVDSRSHHTL